MNKEQEQKNFLNTLYTSPATGYRGAEHLYKQAKKHGLSRKFVTSWLESNLTYGLHKKTQKKYPRNKVIVSGIDEQWQCDLVDMQAFKGANDNQNYILTCIDLFSKYAWAITIKSKHGNNIVDAFKVIFQQGRKPHKLQSDAGTEFTNQLFQTFLKNEHVSFFTTNSEMKASVVERFNRTLKEIMWRYFSEKNTFRYVDVLSQFMDNYNNSYHRSIGTFPAHVTVDNEQEIRKRAFEIPKNTKRVKFKFKVDDKVRISKTKRQFEKGYWPNWSEEVFIITDRIARHPPVYRLKDQMDEKVQGVFYEQELARVQADNEDSTFIIEKIIKTRKTKDSKGGTKIDYLVKWRGYPDKFNSWVSDIVDVE